MMASDSVRVNETFVCRDFLLLDCTLIDLCRVVILLAWYAERPRTDSESVWQTRTLTTDYRTFFLLCRSRRVTYHMHYVQHSTVEATERVEERDDASWPKICRVRLPFTSRCLSYSSISRYMHSIFRDKTTLRPLRPSLISRDAVSFPNRRSIIIPHQSTPSGREGNVWLAIPLHRRIHSHWGRHAVILSRDCSTKVLQSRLL